MRCLLGTGRGDGDQAKVPSGDWDKVMGTGMRYLTGTGMGWWDPGQGDEDCDKTPDGDWGEVMGTRTR